MSMLAPAFMPEPVKVLVSIEKGKTPRIEFSMKPAGFIRGYVVKNEQRYIEAGKDLQPEAGENLKPDSDIGIESIILKGSGIYRTLIPLKEEGISYSEHYPDHYLSATDFASNGAFFFFGLSTGKYELIINANGYSPYTEVFYVSPGEYHNTMRIELVRETVDSP